MDVVLTVVGAALVAFALRDVFDTLWHPSKHGMLSAQVGRLLWRSAHRLRRWPAAGSLVGPVTLAAVLVLWALMLV